MRKIIAAEFVTLDGVMEAPGSGDTTLPERRGWSEPYMNEEIGKLILDQMDASDALLLGRKTYQDFAVFWPSVPDEDPFGKRMNNTAKYVVSTTLDEADWKNSRLIKGDVVEEVSRLKGQPGKNITIVGSGELVNMLMGHDLIDEYQLMVCPVVLGVGKRLFNGSSDKKALRLVDTKAFNSGMLLLRYQTEK
jgi:dihydrofolate reductase